MAGDAPHITICSMHAQTQRQREVLDFITRYIESHGYRPSYQVIARQMGVRSRSGIGRIVTDLERQGLLSRRRENGHFYLDVGRSRHGGSSDTGAAVEWLDVPDIDSDLETWEVEPLAVPPFLLGVRAADRMRAYKVGDSGMMGEHICQGDIGLIELRQFPRDGELVVAILEGSRSVLRRYFRVGSEIELRASDGLDGPESIRMLADRVQVCGVLRGLLRAEI